MFFLPKNQKEIIFSELYLCLHFCKRNIFVGLQAFLHFAKAIFKLAGRIQYACAGAKRLCERRIAFTLLCTNDCLMCKLARKIYSEKPK